MAGNEAIVVNGHNWTDATNATTAGWVYSAEQIRAAGGDPRKLQKWRDDDGRRREFECST